jgi:hypothetical protein
MEPLVLKTLFGTITFSKDGISFDGLTFSWEVALSVGVSHPPRGSV